MSDKLYFVIDQTVDLARANMPMHYEQPLISGDAEGHMWRVHVRRNGLDVPLDGYTVSCYVRRDIRRKDGTTEPAIYIPGSVQDGDATAILAADVYALDSPIVCVMRVSRADGQVISTAMMYARAGTVVGDEISDPTGSIKSLEELLAQIERMEAGTAAANTATANANTAAANANSKAAAANTAAGRANTAADRLSDVDLEVTMLPPSSDPTAEVTQTATQTTFKLGIPTSNLAYATFEVETESMELLMHSPDGFDDISFSLNNGVLEVSV